MSLVTWSRGGCDSILLRRTAMSDVGTDRETLLITAFVGLADTLVDDFDIIDLLDRLAGYSVELLAAESAGIVLADAQRNLRVVASTNEHTEWMELMQLQADEGPCVECFRTVAPVSVEDLTVAAARWPRFAAALADHQAYRSVHALPLRLRGEAIGALNLFHGTPGGLPAADLALGQALADVATIGILSERAIQQGEVLNEQLQIALNSRVIIEQAKGVLAQRGDLSMDAAFDRLRTHARDNNLRLSEVARQVVESDVADVVLAGRTTRKQARRR
jgi:GAF domain-containing protein